MGYKVIDNEGKVIQKVEWLDEINDGWHTMNDLYKQRAFLFAIICKAYKDKAHITFHHEPTDKPMPQGKFFVWVDTPKGMYGYHYLMEELHLFEGIKQEPYDIYDGFTDKDVVRLLSLENKNE